MLGHLKSSSSLCLYKRGSVALSLARTRLCLASQSAFAFTPALWALLCFDVIPFHDGWSHLKFGILHLGVVLQSKHYHLLLIHAMPFLYRVSPSREVCRSRSRSRVQRRKKMMMDAELRLGHADEHAGKDDAKDRAQLRRAQVRKAQIQHRQRKANYVKQLELDVSQLRDLITQAQQETLQMRRENDGIRDLLRTSEQHLQPTYPQADSTYFSNAGSPGTRVGGMSELDTQEWLGGGQLGDLDLNLNLNPLMPSTSNEVEMFGHINIDDLTVSLGIHDLLGTPCFTINSSSGASIQNSISPPPPLDSTLLTPPLTPQQEQIVINWILA